MSPRLHVVPAPIPDPAQWLWSGANPADAPAPRVLCGEMSRRLAALNAAARELRRLGVRIVEQALDGAFPADNEPSIRIERDPATPFGPFLDAALPRTWVRITRDGQILSVAYTSFHGVLVTWEERV